WDRLPLRVGVVAFPRMTPFQTVIEAARNVEVDLDGKKPETWRVTGCETRDGVAAISLKSPDQQHEMLRTMPVQLPDAREAVFYRYLAVADKDVRLTLDLKPPGGQVFRHAKNLRSGAGVRVYPSLISTIFMASTAGRFAPIDG